MKTKVILVSLLLAFAIPAFAQQQTPNDVVIVKKSDLTPEQLAKVQKQEMQDQLGAYKEYAEMGRGIGLAVGESLKAVKDVAIDFSKTDVGKYTMFLIAWKVMAKDVVAMGNQIFGYLVGIPFLAIGLSLCALSYYRQIVPRRVVIEKGPGLWIWRSKKYEIYDPAQRRDFDLEGQFAVHGIAALVLTAIGAMVIF